MQCHRDHSGVLRDPAGVEIRLVLVVDADPELDRDGQGSGRFDGAADYLAEQGSLVRQRGPATSAGDFRNRAAEVEVDVVCEIFVADHLHGLADRRRVDAVELHRARPLPGIEADHFQGTGMALEQRPAGDHLADEQAGPLLAAQPAKRHVGDPGHRREHHRRVDPVRPDP